MDKIFISYRRADSPGIAGRVYDRLVERFGREAIFMDVDSIPPGIDFRPYIIESIKESTLVLVLIGPRWFDLKSVDGYRRLDSPNDPVRFEIETALENNLQVIPVYMGRAAPSVPQVPTTISSMFQNSYSVLRVDIGRSFELDIDLLVTRIARTIETSSPLQSQSGITSEELNAWLLFSWQIMLISFSAIGYVIFNFVRLVQQINSAQYSLMLIQLAVLIGMLAYTVMAVNDRLRAFTIPITVALWGALGLQLGKWLQSAAVHAHRSPNVTLLVLVVLTITLLFFSTTFNVSLFARCRGHSIGDYRQLVGIFGL